MANLALPERKRQSADVIPVILDQIAVNAQTPNALDILFAADEAPPVHPRRRRVAAAVAGDGRAVGPELFCRRRNIPIVGEEVFVPTSRLGTMGIDVDLWRNSIAAIPHSWGHVRWRGPALEVFAGSNRAKGQRISVLVRFCIDGGQTLRGLSAGGIAMDE